MLFLSSQDKKKDSALNKLNGKAATTKAKQAKVHHAKAVSRLASRTKEEEEIERMVNLTFILWIQF